MPKHTPAKRAQNAKKKTQKAVSRKISKLRSEGKPIKQAIAAGINIVKNRKKRN